MRAVSAALPRVPFIVSISSPISTPRTRTAARSLACSLSALSHARGCGMRGRVGDVDGGGGGAVE